MDKTVSLLLQKKVKDIIIILKYYIILYVSIESHAVRFFIIFVIQATGNVCFVLSYNR